MCEFVIKGESKTHFCKLIGKENLQ